MDADSGVCSGMGPERVPPAWASVGVSGQRTADKPIPHPPPRLSPLLLLPLPLPLRFRVNGLPASGLLLLLPLPAAAAAAACVCLRSRPSSLRGEADARVT